jgi:hypothetical protein
MDPLYKKLLTVQNNLIFKICQEDFSNSETLIDIGIGVQR